MKIYYKGYTGTMYENKENKFYGKLVSRKIFLNYRADTAEKLKRKFRKLINARFKLENKKLNMS